jgi:serine/threonine protein kinase
VSERLARHRLISERLRGILDHKLSALVDAGTPLGTGIGGRTALLHVDGLPVFVKRIPLTDLERRPENVRSTANLFHLPTFYQYGVGSTGFGAWRELAIHELTTNWVLDGHCASFPLTHHWRVLPHAPGDTDLTEIESMVAYWDGSPAVRGRLEAIAAAPASVVLFLEYVPHTLHSWLLNRFADHTETEAALEMVDREIHAGIDFMQAHGMVHFDAHPGNVLTDGRQLFFADFGLALHPDFELSEVEADFLHRNADYDRRDVERYLVNWLVTHLRPEDGQAALRSACIAGSPPADIAPRAAAIIGRYGRTAEVMNDFYAKLVAGPKSRAVQWSA